MRLLARINIAASLATVVLTAACSDSSGPSAADQATAIAARFDSIYVDATAQSNGGANAYVSRAGIASLLEVPPAFGAIPSTITVTTASGSESWKGFEFVDLTPSGTDSNFVLLAYREEAAHTVLAVIFDSTGAPYLAGLITGDTLSASPDSGSAATTLVSVGAACRTPPSSLTNPEFDTPFASSCSLATFRTSLTLQFPSSPGIEAALASLTFAPTAVNGIRVVDPLTGRRVNSLLHALRSAKRL
ncbi:MAG TPA: hypothetical protein VK617_14680 [Gemmatimonadaceae bacterium]|jgi:hypothetical protein|nr:hypothetical protein [Gemmatimonadaceae bacterium]